MNAVSVIVTILILLCPTWTFSGTEETGVLESERLHNFEATAREVTASADFSKEVKIKNFMDSDFAVARGKGRNKVYTLLPEILHPLVDGDIYTNVDTGLGMHYIFFILDPPSWIISFKELHASDRSWLISDTGDHSLHNPLILINFEKGLSLTITFWEKSPPTCQITELDL